MIGARGLTSAGAIFGVLLMLLGVFAIPTSASAADENVTDKLLTESGPTEILGGGDHFFVKFGTDAAFGVVWGTQETPNNVYFVAIKARYLGVAQVYDSEGNLVKANQTVKVATLYAVKLEDMLEFNDSEKALTNGTFLGVRVYENGNFTGDFIHLEELYKRVDLKTAWTASSVVEDATDDTRSWTFDLTATDLPYIAEDNYSGPAGDNKLNELTLTFHLEAKMVRVDDASIPQWRVTVAKGMMGNMWWFTGIEPMEPKVVSGNIVTYHVKWDQKITGWDNDSANMNPVLLMEFSAIVGNYIPPALATAMHMGTLTMMNMMKNMNEDGYATCRDSSGDVKLDPNTPVYTTPKRLTTPTLTFGGDNTRIGKFEWVSNVTVDGVNVVNGVHSQLFGGVPIWAIGQNGAVFAGFAVLGGLSFPFGAVIDHDPTFSSDALVIGDGARIPVGMLGLAAIMTAIIAIVVVVLVMMERKPGQKVQQSYERRSTSQQADWSKYYQKK
ncbi:MAG TPA: hypothetical protein VJ489_01830 [Thermoplasmata archaeon]|nr:hypothetical protein [Thermoplasmata archaeon]